MKAFKFNVSKVKEKALLEKMNKFNIKEEDIFERFIRSGGHGGQNVNKTATCVYLKHLPTGIEVKCQRERSQGLNRFFARRRLTEKIESLILGNKSSELKRIYKLKKQKQKRSKRAKEKVLEQKRIQSGKKALRKPPSIQG